MLAILDTHRQGVHARPLTTVLRITAAARKSARTSGPDLQSAHAILALLQQDPFAHRSITAPATTAGVIRTAYIKALGCRTAHAIQGIPSQVTTAQQ